VDPVSAAAAEIDRHFPERAFATRAGALFCYALMRMNSEIATSTLIPAAGLTKHTCGQHPAADRTSVIAAKFREFDGWNEPDE
jgi:hypothetical protein